MSFQVREGQQNSVTCPPWSKNTSSCFSYLWFIFVYYFFLNEHLETELAWIQSYEFQKFGSAIRGSPQKQELIAETTGAGSWQQQKHSLIKSQPKHQLSKGTTCPLPMQCSWEANQVALNFLCFMDPLSIGCKNHSCISTSLALPS